MCGSYGNGSGGPAPGIWVDYAAGFAPGSNLNYWIVVPAITQGGPTQESLSDTQASSVDVYGGEGTTISVADLSTAAATGPTFFKDTFTPALTDLMVG